MPAVGQGHPLSLCSGDYRALPLPRIIEDTFFRRFNLRRGSLESIELARRITDVIADKKGEDILLLDIHALSIYADYIVICNGTSDRQLKALVAGVREEIKKDSGIFPHHIEGEPASGWVLMDYGDTIVHIFDPELREYYALEELLRDGKVLLRMQ